MLEWLTVLSYRFVISSSAKKSCLLNFHSIKNCMMLEIVAKYVFKIMALQNNLLAGFKTILWCSVHPKWFVKYVFPAKIWFVKILTRIVNYGLRVVKKSSTKLTTQPEVVVSYAIHSLSQWFSSSKKFVILIDSIQRYWWFTKSCNLIGWEVQLATHGNEGDSLRCYLPLIIISMQKTSIYSFQR